MEPEWDSEWKAGVGARTGIYFGRTRGTSFQDCAGAVSGVSFVKTVAIPVKFVARPGRSSCLGAAVLFGMSLCVSAEPRTTHLQTVKSAFTDSNGRVHVVTGKGREVILSKEKGQESVEPPVVADDNRTVGWLVNFPNCCTSYPIPMTIVLYRDGQILHRVSNGRAIFRWQFWKGSEQIAYFSDTLHGNLGPECTLVDVGTGKTLEKWSRGDGTLPPWAEAFADDIGPIDFSPQ
jgi:hypothetical protein